MQRGVSWLASQWPTTDALVQRADSDMPQCQFARVVALDAERARGREPEVREFPELARRDLRLPVRAAELVLDDFLPVEPVLDVRAVDDDAGRVPFAVRLDDARRRGVQPEVGCGRTEPVAAVRRVRIVEQLVLRRAPEDVFVLVRAAIEEAAVPALADLPFQLELEVAEELARDEVLDLAVL